MTTYTWMKEEGRQEGILQKETEVILQGYEEGLNIHLLAKITKLSEQEVIKILKEHQKIKD